MNSGLQNHQQNRHHLFWNLFLPDFIADVKTIISMRRVMKLTKNITSQHCSKMMPIGPFSYNQQIQICGPTSNHSIIFVRCPYFNRNEYLMKTKMLPFETNLKKEWIRIQEFRSLTLPWQKVIEMQVMHRSHFTRFENLPIMEISSYISEVIFECYMDDDMISLFMTRTRQQTVAKSVDIKFIGFDDTMTMMIYVEHENVRCFNKYGNITLQNPTLGNFHVEVFIPSPSGFVELRTASTCFKALVSKAGCQFINV
jgi:hypothetical protein